MEFVVANLDDLRLQIVTEFERLAAAGPLSCGLSGGPTALIFLGALRTAKPDWSRVSLFWVDERAVPPDDPESNYGLARRMLIDPLQPRGPRAFPMPAAQPDLETGGASTTTTSSIASWTGSRWISPSSASVKTATSPRSFPGIPRSRTRTASSPCTIRPSRRAAA